MKQPSDSDLIKRIKEGNILAFEQLLKRYEQSLVSYATSILRSRESAEEVVQDALFGMYTRIDQVDERKKFSSYIYAIVKNRAVSYLRGQKRTVPLGEKEYDSYEEEWIEYLYRKDVKRDVKRALSKIDKKYRQVITLYYFSEMSYEEIAKGCNIPINTVRTYLYRGKQALKQYVTL